MLIWLLASFRSICFFFLFAARYSNLMWILTRANAAGGQQSRNQMCGAINFGDRISCAASTALHVMYEMEYSTRHKNAEWIQKLTCNNSEQSTVQLQLKKKPWYGVSEPFIHRQKENQRNEAISEKQHSLQKEAEQITCKMLGPAGKTSEQLI